MYKYISEKHFLRAMAELGPNAQRTGDIAEILNIKVGSLGPLRAKLLKKGMIYSPAKSTERGSTWIGESYSNARIATLER